MGSDIKDSTSFKVTDLLKEVELDYSSSTTKRIDDTLSAIKEAIDKIPEGLKVTADAAPGFVRDIGADKVVEFKFKKPQSIEIAGSYSMGCVVTPDLSVDLFVRLPKECFNEKDYLNHRYHAKRCLYLCIIKKYLESSSLIQKVEWSTYQNEVRKPVLVVFPDRKLVEVASFSVKIIPTAPSLFSTSKLSLKRNNVRALKQATPKYNSSILEDMFMEEISELIRKIFQGWKEIRDALILLKVWARCRSSIYAHDCLNGFLISVMMAYLASQSDRHCIKTSMNAMQIFRVTLDFIATSKLWEIGLVFGTQSTKTTSKEERRTYSQLFPVVIMHGSFADYNLAFRMTRSGFLELQDEAALTLSCIDKCRDGGFDEIFMTKIDFPVKYDYCIRLNLKGNSEVYSLGFCLDDECWRLYEQKVHALLHQGLVDRVKFIRIIWRNTISGCNIENGLSELDREPLFIGVSASSVENAERMVDVGPSPENKDEAFKFRKFWGDKAELRRFADGKIAESTYWGCKEMERERWKRHLIIKRITEHILLRHLSLSKGNIMHVADQLDFCLLHGAGDPIAFSGNLLEAFEILSKHLRHLNEIPLRVSSVQPLDSAFRFTSVCPPAPHPLAYEKVVDLRSQKLISTCIQPLEVMIQLEGSGNWPMGEIAIEKTKTAFLLKIGESLESKWGMMCTATEDDVDVFVSGYAFRLKILHERGLSLLKKQIGSDQFKRVYSTDRKLFVRGQHSSMINGLQGRYPTYGPVVRLAKRWVAAHLFSTSLVEEAIELLVAYLFLKPLPFYTPCSRITGFLRFLRLLSEYDWAYSALIVDINSDFTLDDEKEISENFLLSRKACVENKLNFNPAMFLATAYDKSSEAWTKSSPNSSELRRLVTYARSSADLLTRLILQDQVDAYRWECLFRTPLNNYDAVILLHKDRLPYPQRLLFPSELKLGKHVVSGNASKIFYPFISPGDRKGSVEDVKSKLMVDFDPLKCFVGDLEREFPGTFKAWYDSLGGDAIGLTWKGSCSNKRGRGEGGEEEKDLIDALKRVGQAGKGFVRSIHFLKAPKLRN